MLNTLLLNCLLSTGQLKEGEGYDVDFDHQFIEAEKFDAKPTYKKFLGYHIIFHSTKHSRNKSATQMHRLLLFNRSDCD